MSLRTGFLPVLMLVLVSTLHNSCRKEFVPVDDGYLADAPPLPVLRTGPLNGTFSILTHQVPRFQSADIVLLSNGTLFGVLSNNFLYGEYESIFKTISTDGGITWSTPAPINMPATFLKRYLNTNLLLSNGRLFLIIQNIKTFAGKYKEGDIPLISYSDDNGETWSEPKLMLKGPSKEFIIVNSRNCTRTKTGRLIVPVSYGSHIEPQRANILYSDDNGANWKEGPHPLGWTDANFGEPSVAQLNDGRLIMLIRNLYGDRKSVV